jgi:hypothetical protein
MRVDEMKKKSDWSTFEKLAERLDGLVAAEWKLGEFTPYAAAKELGVHPNPWFYKNFDAWEDQRTAQAKQPFVPVTPKAEADFRTSVSKASEEFVSIFVRQVGQATGLVYQDAEERVTKAELKASTAIADRSQLLDGWAETEREFNEAIEVGEVLAEQLAAANLQIAKLEARLEERAALIQAMNAPAAHVNAAEQQLSTSGQTAGVVMNNSAPPSEVASSTGIAESEAGPADGLKFDNRPSESEPDHLPGDHRELPLDSTNSNPNGEEQ